MNERAGCQLGNSRGSLTQATLHTCAVGILKFWVSVGGKLGLSMEWLPGSSISLRLGDWEEVDRSWELGLIAKRRFKYPRNVSYDQLFFRFLLSYHPHVV